MSGVIFRNPDRLYDPSAHGYSHLARVPGGCSLLMVAGQGGITLEGKLDPDFRAQVVQAFVNVGIALADCDASLADVVRTTLLIADHNLERLQIVTEEMKRIWPHNKPVSTLIPVPCLALPGMLVEVEATAIAPMVPVA